MDTEERYPWDDLASVEKSLNVEHFPAFWLTALSGLVQKNLTRYYLEPYGLGLPEWRVLCFVGGHKTVSLREVNKRSWMDKGQISRVCDTLEKRGLIKRTPDPSHGRRHVLSITPVGEKLYTEVMPIARRHQASLLTVLTKRERRVLYECFEKIEQAASAIGLINRASHRISDEAALPSEDPDEEPNDEAKTGRPSLRRRA